MSRKFRSMRMRVKRRIVSCLATSRIGLPIILRRDQWRCTTRVGNGETGRIERVLRLRRIRVIDWRLIRRGRGGRVFEGCRGRRK